MYFLDSFLAKFWIFINRRSFSVIVFFRSFSVFDLIFFAIIGLAPPVEIPTLIVPFRSTRERYEISLVSGAVSYTHLTLPTKA